MELGLGIHGEPGASKGPLQPVDAVVAQVSKHSGTPHSQALFTIASTLVLPCMPDYSHARLQLLPA